ncbi:MAG TPA: hypothetical protein VL336_11345 [Sphingomicrobium sp.]|jgi:hypothetical protein|nr:hypothetical protein [Sphingomicrobium sp.]
MPKLKVFCATSGFHDSIVAAPSRPAALKAWGARTDLFSMGVARQVTDPKIVKKALAQPGEVIRLTRTGDEAGSPAPKKAARKKPAPRSPSRSKLAAAEQRLEELEQKQSKEREAVEQELQALERKRGQLDKRHARARRDANEKVDDARQAYEDALARWDG